MDNQPRESLVAQLERLRTQMQGAIAEFWAERARRAAVFARAQDMTRDVMRQLLAKHGITGPTAEAAGQEVWEILLAVAHGPQTAQSSSARDPGQATAR